MDAGAQQAIPPVKLRRLIGDTKSNMMDPAHAHLSTLRLGLVKNIDPCGPSLQDEAVKISLNLCRLETKHRKKVRYRLHVSFAQGD